MPYLDDGSVTIFTFVSRAFVDKSARWLCRTTLLPKKGEPCCRKDHPKNQMNQ